MIALKIKHNDQTVSVAGDTRTGLISFSMSAQCFDKGDEMCRGYAYAHGVYDTDKDDIESLYFLDLENLKIGDKLSVEICEVDTVDKPIENPHKDSSTPDFLIESNSSSIWKWIGIGIGIAIPVLMLSLFMLYQFYKK